MANNTRTMGVLKKLQELLGYSYTTHDYPQEESSETYANPTHEQFNRDLADRGQQRSATIGASTNVPVFVRPATNTQPRKTIHLDHFQDYRRLKALMQDCIADYTDSGGVGFATINEYAVMHTLLEAGALEESEDAYLRSYDLRELLKNLRAEMQKDGLISYNATDRAWFIRRSKEPRNPTQKNATDKYGDGDIKLRAISDNESKFLQLSGHGIGWFGVSDIDTIPYWIHQNLKPEEFEGLCVSLMNKHLNANLVTTRKRKYSEADGGVDGIGTHPAPRGENISVAIQAKCYKPDYFVGEDAVYKFSALLARHHINHGYMMTNARMSERAIETTEAVNHNTLPRSQVILIDGDTFTSIILENNFGIIKTPEDFLYINPRILMRVAKDGLKNPAYLDDWVKTMSAA